MSPLAIILQAAICGAVVVSAVVYVAGLAIYDHLHPSMSALMGLGGEQLPDEDDDPRRYEPDEPGPCAWHWTNDGSPCGCDPDADGDEQPVEDDPGAEWDRAHDRWTDGQLGVA